LTCFNENVNLQLREISIVLVIGGFIVGETKRLPYFKQRNFTVLKVVAALVVCVISAFFLGRHFGGGNQPLTAPYAGPKPGVTILYLGEVDGIRIRVEPEDREVLKKLEEYLDKFPGAKVKGHSTNH